MPEYNSKDLINNNGLNPKTFAPPSITLPSGTSQYDEGFRLSGFENPVQAIEDYKGEEQPIIDKWANAVPRVLSKAGLEAVKGFGYTYALGEALFTDATLPEALNNSFIQGLDTMEEAVKEKFAIFTPKDVREGNIWDNLISASFYTNEGADALGYLMSAMIPGTIYGKIGGISKLGELTKINPTVLKTLDLGALSLYQTGIESMAEVGEYVKNTELELNKLVSDGTITEEEKRDRLASGAKNVFLTNAAVLAGPNFIMNKWLLGRYFKDADAARLTLNTEKGIFEAPSKYTFKENAKNFLGKAGLATFSEGFWEEGIQGVTTDLNKKLALMGEDPGMFDYISSLADEYINKLQTTEQQKAIFLGALLGTGASINGLYQDNKKRNSLGPLANFLELNRGIFDKNISNLLYNENGETKINISSLKNLFESELQAGVQSHLMDAAVISGKKDVYDFLFNKSFTQFVIPFLNYNDGLDTINDYLDLISKKLIDQMKQVDPAFKESDEKTFITNLKKRAEAIKKDYERFSNIINRLDIKGDDQKFISTVKEKLKFAATSEKSYQQYLQDEIESVSNKMSPYAEKAALAGDVGLFTPKVFSKLELNEISNHREYQKKLERELEASNKRLDLIVDSDRISDYINKEKKRLEDDAVLTDIVKKEVEKLDKKLKNDSLKTGTALDGLDLVAAYEKWSNTKDYSPEDVQAFKDQLTSTINQLKSVDPIKLTDEILLAEIQKNKALRSLGSNVLPLLKKELGLATAQSVEDEFPDFNQSSDESSQEKTKEPVKSGESKFRGFGEFTTLFYPDDKHRPSRIAASDPNIAKNIIKLRVDLNTPSKPKNYNSKVKMVGGKYIVSILNKDGELVGYLPHSKQFLDMSGKPIDIQNLTEAQFKDLFEPDAKYSLKEFKAVHKALENFEAYLDRQGVTNAGMILAKDWIDKHVRINVTTGEFNFITKDQPLTRATDFGANALINGNPFIVELPISKKQNDDGTYVINGYGLPRIFGEGLFEEDGKYPAWIDSSTLKLKDTANAIFKGKNIFTSRYAMLVADSGGVVDINGTMYTWVFLHPNTFENPEAFVEELNDTKDRLAAMPVSDSRMQELKLANEALLDKIFIASSRGTSIQLNLVGSQTTGGIQFSVEFYSELDSFKDRVYFDTVDSFQDLVAKIEEARKTSSNPNILALEPITERSIRENISTEEFKDVDSDKLKSFLNRLGSVVSKNIKTEQNINITFGNLTPPVQPKQTNEEQAPDDFLDAELAAGEALLAKKRAGEVKPTTNTIEAQKADIEKTLYGTISGSIPLSQALPNGVYVDLGDGLFAYVDKNDKIAAIVDKNNGYIVSKSFWNANTNTWQLPNQSNLKDDAKRFGVDEKTYIKKYQDAVNNLNAQSEAVKEDTTTQKADIERRIQEIENFVNQDFFAESELLAKHWKTKKDLFENKVKQLKDLLQKGIKTGKDLRTLTNLLNDIRGVLNEGLNINNKDNVELNEKNIQELADSLFSMISDDVIKDYINEMNSVMETRFGKDAVSQQLVQYTTGEWTLDGKNVEYFLSKETLENAKNNKQINAKYDAEIAALESPQQSNEEAKKADIERRRPTSYIRDSKDKKSPLETFRNEAKREWDGVSVITGDRMKNLYVGIQLFVEAYPEHKDLLDKFIKKENGTIGITNNNLSFVLNTLKKQGVTTESELGVKINAKYDAELAALGNEVIPPKKFNNPMAEFAALQLKAKNKTATREDLARMEELQELFTDSDGNFVYKLSKAPSANKLDLDLARNYIASILPSWISVRELDTVMSNLGKYGTVFGKFANDVIYLNKEGAIGTEYHEAFHAVFRVLLNQDEITLYRQLGKTDLLSKLKADNITFDRALEEFKYSHPSRVSLSRVDLINLMIEEHLADKFQSWKLNKKNQGVFAKLFDKILNFLNWITGTDKRDIESLYNKIDSGYFKEMPKVSNNLVASPVYALVTNGVTINDDGSFTPSNESAIQTEIKLNTIIALTFNKIDENNKDEKKFVDIDNKFQRDKFVNQVFKELAIEYSSTNPKYADRDMYEQAEGLTLQEYLRREKYTYTNPSSKKALIDMIDYKLSQYKLSGLMDSLGETDSNEVDAEKRRDINQENIGGFGSLSAEIRQYIGLTTYKFTDQFGIERTRAVDPKKVYEGLTRGTANSLTELDIVKKLYELKDLGGDQGSEFISKFFDEVSLKANDMETSDFYVSIDESRRALYQKVVKAFNLYSLDHLTVGIKFSGSGAETTTSLANKKNVEYNQRVQWAQEFTSFIEPNFKENHENRDTVLTRLNSLVSRYLSAQSAPTNKVADERAEELVSAFHDIGISLSKGYVKYLILSNPSITSKINKGQLSTVVTFKDEISSSQIDTVAYFKQIIDLMMKGNNPFERVNEEVDGKTIDLNQDAVTKIEAIAKDNAIFDESVTNVSFQSSEGKTLYGLQQGTYEVTETLRVAKDQEHYDTLKKMPYLSNNYLVTNPLFELIRKNLKIERVEGIYEDVTNTKTSNKQDGVVYGSMKPRDLMLFQLGSAIDYKTESFLNRDKSVTEVLTAPILISIMETSSTADLVRLPVFKDAMSTEGFSDTYINAIFQEVKREYDRIKRVKDGAEDTWVDYTDGRGLDFWIMKDLLMRNEGLYNRLKNTEVTPEEVQDEINTVIKEYLTEKLNEFYQDLSKLNIIRRNNVGKLVNLLLDPRYEGLATSTNKKIFASNDVELNLANVYLSQYINNISYNQLMIGDPALSVKDEVNYTKRNKFRNGSGSTIYSESFKETKYIVFEEPVEDGTKVADAQSYGTPRFFRNLFESLGRLDEKSRAIYDKLEKGEEDLSFSDIKYLKKRNAMTNSIKITGGDRNVNIKTSTSLLHKRLVGYTNEEGKFVAIPGMENLFAMYNRMIEDSVDISMPKTAMKRAVKKLVSNQTFDSGGKGGVNSIDNNFVRLQMENPSNKTQIKYATQVQSLLPFETTQQNSHLSNEYKKSFTDIMTNNFNLLNEVVRDFQTGEVDLTYFKTIVSEILLSSGASDNLLAFFSPEKDYNLNLPATLTKFRELYTSHFKSAFSLKVPGYKATLQSDWGVNILCYKDDTNRIVNLNMFHSNPKYYQELYDSGTLITRRLEERTDKDGITYAECLISAHFAEQFNLKPGDEFPKELMDCFGNRIPASDKHSMTPLRIIGVLPASHGSNLILPAKLIDRIGHDFDVDAFYIHRPAHYVVYSEDGTPVIRKYGNNGTDSMFSQYMKYIFDNQAVMELYKYNLNRVSPDVKLKEIATLYRQILKNKNVKSATQFLGNEQTILQPLLKKQASELLNRYLEDVDVDTFMSNATGDLNFEKDSIFLATLRQLKYPTTEAEYTKHVKKNGEINNNVILNKILDLSIKIWSLPEMEVLRNTPESDSGLKAIAEKIAVYKGKKGYTDLKDKRDPFTMNGLNQANAQNRAGSVAIGAAVNSGQAFTLLNEFAVQLNNAIRFKINGIEHNDFLSTFSRFEDIGDEKRRVMDNHSTNIVGMTDSGNTNYPGLLNLDIDSLSVVSALISRGVPIETAVYLANLDSIKEYMKLTSGASLKTPSELKNRKEGVFTNILKEYEKKHGEIANKLGLDIKVTDNIDLQKENIVDGLKGIPEELDKALAYYDTHVQALKLWNKMSKEAFEVGHLNALIKLNKGLEGTAEFAENLEQHLRGIGYDYIVSNGKVKLVKNEALSKELELDFSSIVNGDPSFRATIEQALQFVYESKEVFIDKTPIFRSMRKIARATMYSRLKNAARVMNEVDRNLMSFLTIQGYKNHLINEGFEEDLKQLSAELVFKQLSDNKFDAVVMLEEYIKKYPKLSKNPLVNSLRRSTRSDVSKLEYNTRSTGNKGFERIMVDSFTEMYRDPELKPLAKVLFNYLIMKDSMQYRNNSYLQLIPPFMFEEMSKSMYKIQDILSKDNFTNEDSQEVFGLTKDQLMEDFYDKHFRYVRSLNQLSNGNITKTISTEANGEINVDISSGIDKEYYNNYFVETTFTKDTNVGELTKEEQEKAKIQDNNRKRGELNKKAISDSNIFTSITLTDIVKGKPKTLYKVTMPLYFKTNVVNEATGSRVLKIYKLTQVDGKPLTYDMLNNDYKLPIGETAKYVEVSTLGNTNADVLPFAMNIQELDKIARLEISSKIKIRPSQKLADMTDAELLASAPSKILRELDAPNVSKTLGTEEFDVPDFSQADGISDAELDAGLALFDRATSKAPSKFNPAPSSESDLSNFQKEGDYWVNHATGEKLSDSIYQSVKQAQESKKVQQDKKTDCNGLSSNKK